jgi:hypothetical protein
MAAPSLTVGVRSIADGGIVDPRGGKTGEACVQQTHGKYYEAVSRGKCFAAQTAATGVAPGTAIGTTAPFTLANPAGNNKRLVVQKIGLGVISGTFASGTVHIVANSNPAAAAVTGTAITPVNLDIGNGAGATGKAYTTATLPANPTAIGVLCTMSKFVVDTDKVGPFFPPFEKDIDGEIVIEPGCSVSIESTATGGGSSPLVVVSATWEEVDIV